MTPLRLFGDMVRTRRKALGLTQQQLADQTGLTRTYIGQLERGQKNISLLNMLSIARALHVKATTLLAPLDVSSDVPSPHDSL
jgi:transcriptional regulator with XRE-family HTH domain